MSNESFAEKVARLKAEREAAKQVPAGSSTSAPTAQSAPTQAGHEQPDVSMASTLAQLADVVPDIGDDAQIRENDGFDQLSKFIESIPIHQAYERWIGKKLPEGGYVRWSGNDDSNMVRCPMPNHEDNNPSTWFRKSKNVMVNCQSCGFPGGGPIDLAAIAYGMEDRVHKGSRDSLAYVELQAKIANEFGWEVIKGSGGYVVIPPGAKSSKPGRFAKAIAKAKGESELEQQAPEPEQPKAETPPAPAPAPVKPVTPPAQMQATVTPISAAPSAPAGDGPVYPDMDWRSVFTEDTFIREYAEATSVAPVPEMYNVANALTAVGAALGREVVLADYKPVIGNLFICLLSHTGTGKSTSHGYLEETIREAIPYKDTDPKPRGVKMSSPASTGEGLVAVFRRIVPDPRNPKWQVVEGDIRAVVEYGELSVLTNMALKQGSILKDILHDFYDGKRVVGYTNKGDGHFDAENPFCSIITTTQPEMLDTLLDAKDVASGFLNRWTFFTGTPKDAPAFDPGRQEPDLTRSVEMLKELHDWAASGDPVIMTPDAIALFNPFIEQQVRPLLNQPGAQALGRAELFLKKMILLLAANNKERFVSPRTVQQVLSMWPYFLACYKLVGAEVSVSLSNKLEERIHQILERHKAKGVKLSAKQLKNRMSDKYDTDQILKAISNLEKLGMVKRHLPGPKKPGSGPGAPSSVEKFEAII